MTDALLGAALLAAGVLLGWVLHDRVSRTIAAVPNETARALASSISELAAKALVLRGLPAHVAVPERFAPEGVSYEEREAIETRAVDAAGEDVQTESEMHAALDALLAQSKSG